MNHVGMNTIKSEILANFKYFISWFIIKFGNWTNYYVVELNI